MRLSRLREVFFFEKVWWRLLGGKRVVCVFKFRGSVDFLRAEAKTKRAFLLPLSRFKSRSDLTKEREEKERRKRGGRCSGGPFRSERRAADLLLFLLLLLLRRPFPSSGNRRLFRRLRRHHRRHQLHRRLQNGRELRCSSSSRSCSWRASSSLARSR